jgi:hypothetical protein
MSGPHGIDIDIRATAVEVAMHSTEVYEIERAADGSLIEPKCPECGSRVMREKCLFELGSNCPRHGLREAFIRARVALDGKDT